MENNIMGNTARDILLKKHLEEEVENRKAADANIIEDVKKDLGSKIEITHNPADGIVWVKLISPNGTLLSEDYIDLPTEKTITEIKLDYEQKRLIVYRLHADPLYCDLSALINDFNTKLLNETNRALNAESALNVAIQTEKDRAITAEYDLNTLINDKTDELEEEVNILKNGKVTKQTVQINCAYIQNANGNVDMVPFNEDIASAGVPWRNTQGQLCTAIPTQNQHCANKEYVDSKTGSNGTIKVGDTTLTESQLKALLNLLK